MTTAMDPRTAWLQERRSGIGASDAAAVLGIDSWRTPYQVWADKRGLLEPDDVDSEPMYWGRKLQQSILDAYSERTGREVAPWLDTEIVRHHVNRWLLCTPDGLQTVEGIDGLVQVKTAAGWKAAEWRDEPPLAYQVQVQHEMMVTGYPHATLVVLLGGQRMVWFDCQRNVEFQAALLERLAEFWRRVETGEPPEVDSSVQTSKVLVKLHPADSGNVVTLPKDAATWDVALQQAKAVIKQQETVVRACENRLKAEIGDATYGVLPSGEAYSWRTLHRSGYTVEDCDYRVLRRVDDLNRELSKREKSDEQRQSG